MERPAGRLLSMLELLQNRPRLTGPELALALAVEPRTVRRYVTTLQEMGIPVEAARGRAGGYRLRPGFRLPHQWQLENDEPLPLRKLLQRLQVKLRERAKVAAHA